MLKLFYRFKLSTMISDTVKYNEEIVATHKCDPNVHLNICTHIFLHEIIALYKEFWIDDLREIDLGAISKTSLYSCKKN